MVDDIPVVFNALQDKDKEKIRVAEGSTMTESGVQIAPKEVTQIKRRWEDDRPEIVPPLRFKKVTPQNTLIDLQKIVVEVTYKLPGEGTKVWAWDDERQTYWQRVRSDRWSRTSMPSITAPWLS